MEEKPEKRETVCFPVLRGINLSVCINAKTSISGICGVLFFVSIKAFHLLAFTNQILQGEL